MDKGNYKGPKALYSLYETVVYKGPEAVLSLCVTIRGANETRQLTSYLNSTRSKLDSSELDSKC